MLARLSYMFFAPFIRIFCRSMYIYFCVHLISVWKANKICRYCRTKTVANAIILRHRQCRCHHTKNKSRIVAKVDELMALCDKLETQQQQRRSLQNNLRQSTLQAVARIHQLRTNCKPTGRASPTTSASCFVRRRMWRRAEEFGFGPCR